MTYKRIDTLTSLRFIAVAMIVVHHSRGLLWLSPGQFGHFALHQGVSFFFVLSGFILTYVYPGFNDSSSIKRFLLARFTRIWPLHLAAFLTLFGWLLPWSLQSMRYYVNALIGIMNLLLVHGWVPVRSFFFSWNAVTWAVSAEVFFYLAFPFLIKDFETTWRRKLIVSALTVVSLIILCNVTQFPTDNALTPDVISRTGILYINPLSRLFEFILGMCTCLLWKKYHCHVNLRKTFASLLELLAIFMVIFSIYLSMSANKLVSVLGPAGCEYLIHTGSSVSFAALILVMALESGLLSQVMRKKIPVLLGEASYAIFLFHQIILRFYTSHAQEFSSIPLPLLYVFFWIFLLVLSFFVLLLIERPARRLIFNLFMEREA